MRLAAALALALAAAGPRGAEAAGAAAAAGLSPAAESWQLGPRADARLLKSGWRRVAGATAWQAEVELRLVNRDLRRPFRKSVRLEFLDPAGKVSAWKTFVNLGPGAAQHRRYAAPRRLDCPGPLERCPALRLRLGPGRPAAAAALPLSQGPLEEAEAPPAGQPLWVAAVEEGPLLKLLDGKRVRLLGLRLDRRPQAAAWLRERLMDSPLSLAYDGAGRDAQGRWQAYAQAAGVEDLGAELLRLGLARAEEGPGHSRAAAYRALGAR